jgi:hypothetical protein
MVIRHKGRVVARDIRVLKRCFERARGLLFRPKIKEDQAFVFYFPKEGYWSFHMFFMTYAIDIIWLDREKRIVDMIAGFKPFEVHKPSRKARYVIEMPVGKIKKYKIREKDKLEF